MNDAFSSAHPLINFVFFTAVLLITIFFLHPVMMAITFASSMAYSIYLNGVRAIKFNLLGMLPLLLVMAALNPVFNHAGDTILVYVNDNPITLESILYGIASAVMFVSSIMWFSCYNVVMTSDKFIYLFGRVIPALSLIISMTLRFVPRYKAQLQAISYAQKCIGRDVTNGNILTRARNGLKILSIMTTWALENAIETADSMKSRGYGLRGRTSFSIFRFDTRDRILLTAIIVLLCAVITSVVSKVIYVKHFPFFKINTVTLPGVASYIAFALLCSLPLILDITQEVKWRLLKSGI